MTFSPMPTQLVLPRRTILWLLIIFAVAGGGVAGYIYLPAATITVQAREIERSVTQEIFLSVHADQPDFAKFVLPAQIVERTAEESKQVKRVGAKTSEDFARGSIVLVNDRDEEQQLLPKTHLKHVDTGVYFLTDTPVSIPPHNKVAMTITAKEKGDLGNVGPGRFVIDRLPESLQADVWGESEQPTSGGIIVESPVTAEEIGKAREELLETVRGRLLGELTAEAGGAALRPDLLAVELEEEMVSAQVGSKAREFNITVKVRARAFVVDENDLLSLTLLALRSNVEADEEFVSYAPESFDLAVTKVDFDRDEAQIRGTLTGSFASKVGPTVLSSDNLAGLSAGEVREHFRRYPGVGAVDVSFWPFWVRTVPARAKALEIAIKETQ